MNDVVQQLQKRVTKGYFALLGLVLAALLSVSVTTWAVGLGELRTDSYLNQRLHAEIPLHVDGDESLDQVGVRLASNEAHEAAGVGWSDIHSQLQFEVVETAGEPRIRITSDSRIREPFLQFLLEVTTPGGQMRREYVVLIDPPEWAPEGAPDGVAQAERDAPRPNRSTPREAPTTAAEGASSEVATYGPVSEGDTLWTVADRMRPNSNVTVQQVMLALLEHNPEAFAEDNVNALRAGATLELPEMELIQKREPGQALEQVRGQLQTWEPPASAEAVEGATEPGQTMETSGTDQAAASPTTPEPELVLVSTGGSGEEEVGDGAGNGGAELDALRDELVATGEGIESLAQESEHMRRWVQDLETQIEELSGLVRQQSQEMAALRERLAEERASGSDWAWSDTVAELQSQPLMLGGGVAGLLLLLALLLAWRRRRLGVLDAAEADVAAPATKAAGEPEPNHALAELTGGDQQAVADSDVDAKDPLAAADEHLAFGETEEAESRLRAALAEAPERQDYRFKLVEVLVAQGKMDAFVAEAETLYAVTGGEGEYWERARGIGRQQRPEHPLFDEAGASGASLDDVADFDFSGTAGADGPDRFDLTADFDLEGPAQTDAAAAPEASGDVGGDDGGFDLDFDFSGTGKQEAPVEPADEAPASVAESKPGEAEGDPGLDFDLGGLKLDGGAGEDPAALGDAGEPGGPGISAEPEDEGVTDALEFVPNEDERSWFQNSQSSGEPDSAGGPVEEEPAAGTWTLDADETSSPHGEPAAVEEPIAAYAADKAGDSPGPADGGGNEVATQLKLARAYADMGDHEGARELLDEVLVNGDEAQRQEAKAMIDQLS